VTDVDASGANVYTSEGNRIALDLSAVEWARPRIDEDRRGATPKHVSDVLKRGDIVRVQLVTKAEKNEKNEKADKADKAEDTKKTYWMLSQMPVAESAFVALNPEDGAIETLVGGFSFLRSKFNRVTQSNRSPGSGFKPFLYSAAFDHGFTPASVVNDAPVVFPDPSKPNGLWTPKNDDDTFQGPIRLREALVKSVNLVSVRVLDAIGVHYAREYITRFGLPAEQIPENLSMALGTASVSPLIMARGYAVFANGGYLVQGGKGSEPISWNLSATGEFYSNASAKREGTVLPGDPAENASEKMRLQFQVPRPERQSWDVYSIRMKAGQANLKVPEWVKDWNTEDDNLLQNANRTFQLKLVVEAMINAVSEHTAFAECILRLGGEE